MLEIWFSVGYILLLAILLFAFILWRSDSALIAIAALVVGLAYLTWWEYARPTWTTGTVSGTEVRRSEADARGMTHDIHSSEERRVGKGCVSKCRTRGSPDH